MEAQRSTMLSTPTRWRDLSQALREGPADVVADGARVAAAIP
jgi:hypothetical protein